MLPFLPIELVRPDPNAYETKVFDTLFRTGKNFTFGSSPLTMDGLEAATSVIAAIPGSATIGIANRRLDVTHARATPTRFRALELRIK